MTDATPQPMDSLTIGSSPSDVPVGQQESESQNKNRPKRPSPDREALRREIDALSRNPFRTVLVDFLESSPSPGAIRKAAQKSPDRWTQALSIISKLAGFNEKLEIEGTVRAERMSDSEIEQRIQQLIEQRIPTLPALPEPSDTATQAV
jgi:hypothetical protein